MIVHLSDWAQQPSVQIKCTGQYGEPAWKGTPQEIPDLPEGVYALDIEGQSAGVPYTFDLEKVTCPECQK